MITGTVDHDLDIVGEVTVTAAVRGRITVHRRGVLVLMGTAEGGVVVASGGYARIRGTTSSLHVSAGGEAVLSGTCEGEVVCDGGTLTVADPLGPALGGVAPLRARDQVPAGAA